MSDCCYVESTVSESNVCLSCNHVGKSVQLITIKSLLTPQAMKQLNPTDNFFFCRTSDCPIVYFNGTQIFEKSDLIVDVFQKEKGENVPVCYCFGYSWTMIKQSVKSPNQKTVCELIQEYVKEKKCACESRNPQGSCCLGNVKSIEKKLEPS